MGIGSIVFNVFICSEDFWGLVLLFFIRDEVLFVVIWEKLGLIDFVK